MNWPTIRRHIHSSVNQMKVNKLIKFTLDCIQNQPHIYIR